MKKREIPKKLKYTEWRPIGVCDTAPAGVQKAQMFTREDFLTVTGKGVNRTNWRQQPEVMKILREYGKKLSKMSSITRAMKNPQVDKIKLVGSILYLHQTPKLNNESEDGKLQFFQIEFKDKVVNKKKRVMLGLGVLLLMLLVLVGTVLLLQNLKRPRRFVLRSPVSSGTVYQTPYCGSDRYSDKYQTHLDETQQILYQSIIRLYQKQKISLISDCDVSSLSTLDKERQFIRCFRIVKNHEGLRNRQRRSADKVEKCRIRICKGDYFRDSSDCLE